MYYYKYEGLKKSTNSKTKTVTAIKKADVTSEDDFTAIEKSLRMGKSLKDGDPRGTKRQAGDKDDAFIALTRHSRVE